MELFWNPFLTFCMIVLVGGVLYQLLDIWHAYASRPPRCKCRCGKDV